MSFHILNILIRQFHLEVSVVHRMLKMLRIALRVSSTGKGLPDADTSQVDAGSGYKYFAR